MTGEGSLILIHFSSDPLGDYRSTWRAHTDRPGKMLDELFRGLLNRGIYFSTWGLGCLSTPMGELEIDHLADSVLATLNVMKNQHLMEATS